MFGTNVPTLITHGNDQKIVNGDLCRNFLDIFKTIKSQILLELLLCEILLLNIF